MKIISVKTIKITKKATSITRTAVLLLVVSLANCLSASGEKFDPHALFESLGYCLGGGPGTKDNPFVICQYPFFRDIRLRDNWQNQYYALGTNIDARESWGESTTEDGMSQDCASAFSGNTPRGYTSGDRIGNCSGWRPFDLEGGAFNGGIDGRGYAHQ